MSPDPVPPAALAVDAGTGGEREQARNKPLTRPRHGHADLVGMVKYHLEAARPVLERASSRGTASRDALVTVAAALLAKSAGSRLVSPVVSVGGFATPTDGLPPGPVDVASLDADPIRSFLPETSAAM